MPLRPISHRKKIYLSNVLRFFLENLLKIFFIFTILPFNREGIYFFAFLGYNLGMYPYEIGGVITLYGILVALGVLACFVVFWLLAKHDKVDKRYVDFITIIGVVAAAGGFGFAALFQSLYDYIEDPTVGFRYNGLTFQGGLIGGAAIFLILAFAFRNKYKGKLTDVLSSVPLGILLGHSIGRVGCFMAGCCYGLPTDSWIGVAFIDPATGLPMEQKVIPTNLIEAVFLFVAFIVLLIIYLKKPHPYNLALYMILYGIFRFVIEFWRGDDRGSLIPGLSPSQFWSLLMAIAGIPMLFVSRYAWKKRRAELAAQAISGDPSQND